METECEQLYYTSARAGTLGQAGFQTLACSRALGSAVRSEIERLLYYPKPDGIPDKLDAAELTVRCPENFGFALLADGRPVVFLSVYLGCDYSGRAGNFFGHGILLNAVAPPVRPAWLTDWPRFVREASGLAARIETGASTELDAFVIQNWSVETVITADRVSKFLADSDRATRLAEIAEALIQMRATGRRILLHLPGDEARMWLAALHAGLPTAWTGAATFSTFAPDARNSQAAITVLPPGDGVRAPGPNERDYTYVVFTSESAGSSAMPKPSAAARRIGRHAQFCDGWPDGFESWAYYFTPPDNAAEYEAAVALFQWLETGEIKCLADSLLFAKEHARTGMLTAILAPFLANTKMHSARLSLPDLDLLYSWLDACDCGEQGRAFGASRFRTLEIAFLRRFAESPTDFESSAALTPKQAKELSAHGVTEQNYDELMVAICATGLPPENRRAQISVLIAVANTPPANGREPAVCDLVRSGFKTLADNPATAGAILRTSPRVWQLALLVWLLDDSHWDTINRSEACVAAFGDRTVEEVLALAAEDRRLASNCRFRDLIDECASHVLASLEGQASEIKFAKILTSIGQSKLHDSEDLAAGVFARHLDAQKPGDAAVHGCLCYLFQCRVRPLAAASTERVLALLEEKIVPTQLSAHLTDSTLVRLVQLRGGARTQRSPDRLLLLCVAAMARKSRHPADEIRKHLPLSGHFAALDDVWWRLAASRLLDAAARRLRSDEDFATLFSSVGFQTPNRCAEFSKALIRRLRPSPAFIGTAPRRIFYLLAFYLRCARTLPKGWSVSLWTEMQSAIAEFSSAQRAQLLHYARHDPALLSGIRGRLEEFPSAPGIVRRVWRGMRSLGGKGTGATLI